MMLFAVLFAEHVVREEWTSAREAAQDRHSRNRRCTVGLWPRCSAGEDRAARPLSVPHSCLASIVS